MTAFILGTKDEMTQMFDEEGTRIPVTSIGTSPCFVIDIKWPKQHGYCAVKLGFGTSKNIKKPIAGEAKKAGIASPLRFLREVRLSDDTEILKKDGKRGLRIGDVKLFVGDELKPAELFKVADLVNVTGISKGKGFQGVVRRHGFAGGPRTHGQSDRERAPGSIGQSATPGRVYKGKKMAGRMGGSKITVENLKVVEVRDDSLVVKGLVPGSKKGILVVVRKSK